MVGTAIITVSLKELPSLLARCYTDGYVLHNAVTYAAALAAPPPAVGGKTLALPPATQAALVT